MKESDRIKQGNVDSRKLLEEKQTPQNENWFVSSWFQKFFELI